MRSLRNREQSEKKGSQDLNYRDHTDNYQKRKVMLLMVKSDVFSQIVGAPVLTPPPLTKSRLSLNFSKLQFPQLNYENNNST